MPPNARQAARKSPVRGSGAPPAAPQTAEERLKADFRVFLWALWRHLGLPDPTPIQYDIAWYLQHGPRRRIIQAFRGVGKSWITVAYALWRLYCNPDLKILVVSASKTRADEFSTFALRLIEEWEVVKHLAPQGDQRSSKITFDVGTARTSKDPSVKSVGITGQITGSRADLIIPDDIEVPSNSMTQAQRDKLAELVKEFDAVLKPAGEIVYLGTPQTEQSVYLTLAARGYDVRIWPARFPKADKLKGLYAERLAPFIADQWAEETVWKPTDPLRFTPDDLDEREASYGAAGFALQFMLDTTLSDAERYPLRLRDLMVMDLDPERGPVSLAWGSGPEQTINDLAQVGLNGDRWVRPVFVATEYAPYTGKVMYVDPSGGGKDETAWAVVYILHGFLFLMDAGGRMDGHSEETLKHLAETAKRFKVNHILSEKNFGDGMFTKLLTPHLVKTWPVSVEDVQSSGQKERRIIDTLGPIVAQHKLIVNEALIRKDLGEQYPDLEALRQQQYRLFYQMTRVTLDKGSLVHDDRLEAVSGAVRYWASQMDADNEASVERHQQALLDKELQKFMEHTMGGASSTTKMNAFADYL